MKLCSCCRKTKSLDAFHACKTNADGKQCYCIACRREHDRKRASGELEKRPFSTAEAARKLTDEEMKKFREYIEKCIDRTAKPARVWMSLTQFA